MNPFLDYRKFIDARLEAWRPIIEYADSYTDEYLNTKSDSSRILFYFTLDTLPVNLLIVYRVITKYIDAHKEIDEMLDKKLKSLLSDSSPDSLNTVLLASIMFLLDAYATEYNIKGNAPSLIRFNFLFENLPTRVIVMYRYSTELSFVHDRIEDLLAKTKSTTQ